MTNSNFRIFIAIDELIHCKDDKDENETHEYNQSSSKTSMYS